MKLSEVKPEAVNRMSSSFEELDWVYGSDGSYGLPSGRISLWSGEPGVGKSRLIAEIMKNKSISGVKTLLFQGEVTVGQFAEEKFKDVVGKSHADYIHLSSSNKLKDICREIVEVGPEIVIIDSYQTIRDERVNAKSVGQKPIEYVIDNLRKAIGKSGSHLILISQLNKQGESKGSTDLPHLVDVECFLKKYSPDIFEDGVLFELYVNKNRYGVKGRKAVFAHTSEGVIVESSQYMEDSSWSSSVSGDEVEEDNVSSLPSGGYSGSLEVVSLDAGVWGTNSRGNEPLVKRRRSFLGCLLGADV